MKALSLSQPWATLVAISAKRFETRSWNTKHRGQIAIHAAKVFPQDAHAFCALQEFREALAAVEGELPLGVIIATASIVQVHRVETLSITARGRCFGDYAPGRYAFQLADVVELDTPIPCKGALGIWTVPEPIAIQVEISRSRS